jgi:iron complex transport system substrate-binding protein
MRRNWSCWLFFSLVLWCCPCHGAQTVTVKDMAGRTVTAPLAPRRIVCLGPGALRLIVYLQAEDRVVGVEDLEKANPGGRPYWLAHPELAALPRCGPGGPASIDKKPDLEAILAVRPEMVFVTYMSARLADEVQHTSGLPVVVLSYGRFATFDETVYEALRVAGTILDKSQRAEAVIDYIDSLRQDLNIRTAGLPDHSRPSVYVGGIGYRAAYGIESTEQQYAPFEWVGADNAAERVPATTGSHVFLDKERLLTLDPDIIFIDGGGLALVAADYRKHPAFYDALKAFADRRVYTLLPFNWYTTNIGTVLADAYAIGKNLHPQHFSDVDVEKMADDLFTFLVGRPVYAQMKKDYGPIGQTAPFLK